MGRCLLLGVIGILLPWNLVAVENMPGRATTVGTSPEVSIPGNLPGMRPVAPFDVIQKQFAEPPMAYAPFMFWFWDAPVEKENLRIIAGKIMAQKMNPGYAHARYALSDILKECHLEPAPSLPKDQWLGSAWFDAIRGVAGEAQAQGRYFGICDEYWWPTGQAAGRVQAKHPELRGVSLVPQIFEVSAGRTASFPGAYLTVAAQRIGKVPSRMRGDWIWVSDASASKAFFRTSFEIGDPAGISAATLRITADDRYTVFVNGKPAGSDGDWRSVETIDLKNNLVAGKNVLEVEVVDEGGAKGLSAGVEIVPASGDRCLMSTGQDWQAGITGQDRGDTMGDWQPAVVVASENAAPWLLEKDTLPATIISDSIQVIGHGTAFQWKAPESGNWRVYSFSKQLRDGDVNYLDRRLPGVFIQEACVPYEQNAGNFLGGVMPGVFSDHEGHYGPKIAWSSDLEEAFKKQTGRPLAECLPLLIDKDSDGKYARARCDWFSVISEIYGGYFETLSNWWLERKMYFISNLWEENLLWQTYAVGDFMSLQRRVSFPGTDCLQLNGLDVSQFKETQTVTEFEGRRMQTEMMGAANWNLFTPGNIKKVTNAVVAFGADHLVPHGVFTTRKFCNNPWTPDWLDENPTFPFFHLWADFARRATFVNAHGRMVADVLLFNPKETIWMESGGKFFLPGYGMTPFDACELYSAEMKELAAGYRRTMAELTAARIDYLIGDSFYLDRMQVGGGKLTKDGWGFRTVILPPIKILPRSVARKLLLFCQQGGRIFSQGELPVGSPEFGANDPEIRRIMEQLQKLPDFKRIETPLKNLLQTEPEGLRSGVRFLTGAFDMLEIHRVIDGRHFVWMVNNSDEWHTSRIFVAQAGGTAQKWNCEDGTLRRLESSPTEGGVDVSVTFAPYEAFWVVFDDSGKPMPLLDALSSRLMSAVPIDGPWKAVIHPEEQPESENPMKIPGHFSHADGMEVRLEDWSKWGLPRFSGRVDYESTIDVDGSLAQQEGLVLDLGNVAEAAEAWINGERVGERFWPPYRFSIRKGLIVSGKNTVHIRVANNVGNSYGMDLSSGLFGPVLIGKTDWKNAAP